MQVIHNPLHVPADVDTGLDTIGCDDGTDSSGNLMTGLACEMVSSSGKAVISGPLVAENNENVHCQGNESFPYLITSKLCQSELYCIIHCDVI